MEYRILTSEQCGGIYSHVDFLYFNKKIGQVNEISGIMDVPPILITEEGYILNGRHRAHKAFELGLKLEALIVHDLDDLYANYDEETYGVPFKQTITAYRQRYSRLENCWDS